MQSTANLAITTSREEFRALAAGPRVVPVTRKDGQGFDNVRACVDGPAMNAGRILWDRWGAHEPVPAPPEGFPVLAG